MNIVLMVLATARDKTRLVKSAGRRRNCCWDSGGSSGMTERTGKNSVRDLISYNTREISSVLSSPFSLVLSYPGACSFLIRNGTNKG